MSDHTRKPFISIMLWSLSIAWGIFFLMQLRISSLDPYLNDTTDMLFFFTPHVLMVLWGLMTGFFGRHTTNTFYSVPLRHPFQCLFATAVILHVIVSLWITYEDRHHYIDPEVSYLFLAVREIVSLPFIAIFWILAPFFLGYLISIASSFFKNTFFAKNSILLR